MNKGELYYHLNKKNIVQVIETDGDNIIIDFFKQKQYLMSGTDELIRTECDQFELQHWKNLINILRQLAIQKLNMMLKFRMMK